MAKNELNPRQRKFAELIVQGQTAKAAYQASFPRCRSELTAEAEGSRLQHKPVVAAFIAELRAELAEKVKAETVVTLKEGLEFLTEVIRTSAEQVEKGSRLCQSIKQTPSIREVKVPCKLRALELAMKMQGLLNDKVHHEAGDTLKDFLAELRQGDSP